MNGHGLQSSSSDEEREEISPRNNKGKPPVPSSDSDEADEKGENGGGFDSDEEGLSSVIELINKLQSVVSALEKSSAQVSFDLPRIIVCGSQSSGKTSVLESISKEEFLPRGTDIQTRYPIVIQLLQEKSGRKWVEFSHIPEKRFTDMTAVRQILERRNLEVAKSKKVISTTEITVTLHSPNVPDLTMVDLPGLVENPTKDQPPDLAAKIEDVVRRYIANKNSIILAVTEATTDVAASKSIRIANEVDPKRERTVAVITKLDLMDEGTNARDVLTGKKISFRLGIIGVINRSFKDTERRISFADVRRKEEFHLRGVYGPQLAKVNGTAYLTKRISQQLKDSILRNLPKIRKQLDPQIETLQARLEELGGAEVDTDNKARLRRIVTDFCQRYIAQVDGRKRNLNVDTLHAHVRVNMVFDKILQKEINNISGQEDLTNERIITAILNASALHSTTLDADDAFQELAKREIEKMRPVLIRCNNEVKRELIAAVKSSCDPASRAMYPRLFDNMLYLAKKHIQKHYKLSEAYLNDYMSAECSITRSKTIENIQAKIKQEIPTDPEIEYEDEFDTEHSDSDEEEEDDEEKEEEEEEPELGAYEKQRKEKEHRVKNVLNDSLLARSKALGPDVRREVNNCIKRVKVAILEHVPKGIAHKLVYGVSDNIMDFMIGEIYKPENMQLIDDLMHFVDDNADARTECQERLKLLEKASFYIDSILLNRE